MGMRRKARIAAIQGLYAWSETGTALEELREFPWLDSSLDEDAGNFAFLLMSGTIENCDAIDNAIESHLEHWSFDRLTRVDLAILRLSVYALLFQKDIPATVTINEAVEIGKILGSDESYRFVNGVLDAVCRDCRYEA